MKTKVFVAWLGALLVTAGCVQTVTGDKTVGVPFLKDRFEQNYRLPPDVIFTAAKEVIREDGVLIKEGTNYTATNTAVKVVEGKVNECTVLVRVAPLDAQVTSLAVQTRTNSGGSDINLANQIMTQIAVRLASGTRR